MQRRHGAGLDAARKTVAHHQRITLPEFLDEALEKRKIVAIVGVAHDDVASVRSGDSGGERRAVATPRHRNYARTGALGNLARTVARAIVGYYDLAFDAAALQEGARFLHAKAYPSRLVEAGHENRQLHPAPLPEHPQKSRTPKQSGQKKKVPRRVPFYAARLL